jgi:hypothetical protein
VILSITFDFDTSTTHHPRIHYSQEVEDVPVFLDQTLIQAASLQLFDDLWYFLGRAANPSVEVTSSDGEVEVEFSGTQLDQPLKDLTTVPWKKYRKKGLTLRYNLGEWMGRIITFLCIHFEVFPF